MQTHCFKLVEELKKKHTIHDLIWKANYPRGIFFFSVVLRAILKLRKNPNIKVIYINDGLMALMCTPLLFLTKTPMVVTIHGLDINFPSRPYQWWARKYLNQFSRIITVSKPTFELCISKGLKPENLRLVENAVDINFNEIAEDPDFISKLGKEINRDLNGKFILTSLGRAIPRKGFNWFVRNVVPELPDDMIYLVLARQFPQEKLFRWIEKITSKSLFEKIRLMVGAEVDHLRIQHSIEELQLEKKVLLLSQFTDSRDKIFSIIKYSDLFIMPNIKIQGDYEGFGLVALEAASQGTLTLAADVDGIPSAVKQDENGILVPQGDASEWIQKIKYYRDNSQVLADQAAEFKSATIKKGRSWETMSSKYEEVFDEVIRSQ